MPRPPKPGRIRHKSAGRRRSLQDPHIATLSYSSMASTVQNELPGPLVIWLLIVEYLTDQNDLSSVSLSCRQLHRIAARQRWRRISIDLPDESLRRLLRPGCIPSRNIRHIELRDHHNQDFSLTPMLDSLTHSLEFGALRAVTCV